MRCIAALGLAVIVAMVAGTRAITQQPASSQPPISIGVVRIDGMLHPLAQIQEERWTPLATENPARVSDDPATYGTKLTPAARALVKSSWTAFPLDGKASHPLAIRGVASVDSHCSPAEGFRTDAPTRPFPANTFPQPKSALALSGGGTVVFPERLNPPYDPDARRVSRVIVTLTQSIEAERLEATPAASSEKYTAAERGAVPVRVNTLVRHGSPHLMAYYFEALKKYPRGGDVFVRGWLALSGERIAMTNVVGVIADEDYKNVQSARVLGIVMLQDRAVWVFEENGYESEEYVLTDVPFGPLLGTDPRVLRIQGGGC